MGEIHPCHQPRLLLRAGEPGWGLWEPPKHRVGLRGSEQLQAVGGEAVS